MESTLREAFRAASAAALDLRHCSGAGSGGSAAGAPCAAVCARRSAAAARSVATGFCVRHSGAAASRSAAGAPPFAPSAGRGAPPAAHENRGVRALLPGLLHTAARARAGVADRGIPRSALAPAGFAVDPVRLNERVPADVLMGEDGLIRGIRLVR